VLVCSVLMMPNWSEWSRARCLGMRAEKSEKIAGKNWVICVVHACMRSARRLPPLPVSGPECSARLECFRFSHTEAHEAGSIFCDRDSENFCLLPASSSLLASLFRLVARIERAIKTTNSKLREKTARRARFCLVFVFIVKEKFWQFICQTANCVDYGAKR
jgi:hypothetical protein